MCFVLFRSSPMLTGAALLDFVKSNPDKTQNEQARGAGYVSTDKGGKTRLLRTAFNNALLSASGIKFKRGEGLVGKTATYETTVHKSGVILLGKTYSKELGLNPGDPLKIQVESDGTLHLVPIEA